MTFDALLLDAFDRLDVCYTSTTSLKQGRTISMKLDYKAVKVIAIGDVDSAREVIQYDADMRNRVAEITVPLMTKQETYEILDKGEALLNVRFGHLKEEIAAYSSGLPAVCHQLSLNICFAAGITETCREVTGIEQDHFRRALNRYVEDASDTLKAVFDLATRQQRVRTFDNTRLILRALTHMGSTGASYADILKQIRTVEPKYPPGNLTTYLRELVSSSRGEILRYESVSGRYSFRDPLYLAFAQCSLKPPITKKQFTFDIVFSDITKSIVTFLESKHFKASELLDPKSGTGSAVIAGNEAKE